MGVRCGTSVERVEWKVESAEGKERVCRGSRRSEDMVIRRAKSVGVER